MYQKILVPLDGSPLAECVLPHVETIARGCGAGTVVFVRVVEPFHMPSSSEVSLSAAEITRINAENKADAESYLSQLVSRTKYDSVKVQSELMTGRVADSIVDYAARNETDLIVIATHGRSGISRWVWGSVAERILRSSCVPVLMVRAPGCVPGI